MLPKEEKLARWREARARYKARDPERFSANQKARCAKYKAKDPAGYNARARAAAARRKERDPERFAEQRRLQADLRKARDPELYAARLQERKKRYYAKWPERARDSRNNASRRFRLRAQLGETLLKSAAELTLLKTGLQALASRASARP